MIKILHNIPEDRLNLLDRRNKAAPVHLPLDLDGKFTVVSVKILRLPRIIQKPVGILDAKPCLDNYDSPSRLKPADIFKAPQFPAGPAEPFKRNGVGINEKAVLFFGFPVKLRPAGDGHIKNRAAPFAVQFWWNQLSQASRRVRGHF
jgi:hypothetical protein